MPRTPQEMLAEIYGWVTEGFDTADLKIDIIDTIAKVRLELDNWKGHQSTDLFTLLKVAGEWKIMNKVFHLHP